MLDVKNLYSLLSNSTYIFRFRNRCKSSLFLHLKRYLAGKKFDSDVDLKERVEKWLTSQAAHFYEQGIQNLVPHYDKCLNVGGAYVKNWTNICRI
jgi:hypothetical protein